MKHHFVQTDEQIERVKDLYEEIRALLAGQPPEIQGHVLCDLVATWIAAHHSYDAQRAARIARSICARTDPCKRAHYRRAKWFDKLGILMRGKRMSYVVLKDIVRTMQPIDARMSNLYREIDADMEQKLRARPREVYGEHCVWNFFGFVWFEAGLFHEQVWIYHVPQKEISAPTLRELMDAVNAEFGSD
jgi:hypothetical protein